MTHHDENDLSAAFGLLPHIGMMVEITEPCEEHPAGKRGILLSISACFRWNLPGLYCTVALDLADTSDESNVPVRAIRTI